MRPRTFPTKIQSSVINFERLFLRDSSQILRLGEISPLSNNLELPRKLVPSSLLPRRQLETVNLLYLPFTLEISQYLAVSKKA
mmetsp:Transcript_1007/g.1382  ORF Transcript_1007/g.1382 Transcript_1007/m.1382 type:complete len:83 (+) Transcript_1007:253-501(+)